MRGEYDWIGLSRVLYDSLKTNYYRMKIREIRELSNQEILERLDAEREHLVR